MLFKSRDGDNKRVASITGHVVIVGEEPVELPPFMEVDAYTAGCIPANSQSEQTHFQTAERLAIVENKMRFMLSRNGDRDFTAAGLPNKTTLLNLCGFIPSEAEFTVSWNKVKGEED